MQLARYSMQALGYGTSFHHALQLNGDWLAGAEAAAWPVIPAYSCSTGKALLLKLSTAAGAPLPFTGSGSISRWIASASRFRVMTHTIITEARAPSTWDKQMAWNKKV